MSNPIKRLLLITLITSLGIGAIIGIFIFLFGNFGDTEQKLLITTLTLGGFSLTGLCCALLIGKNKLSWFGLLGIIMSLGAFIYSILIIWGYLDIWDDDAQIKTFFILIILALSCAHASLLLLINPKNKAIKLMLTITLLFLAIVAALLVYFIINDFDLGVIILRFLGSFAILDVLGTIVTPITNRMTTSNN